jgi:hypothetical protein
MPRGRCRLMAVDPGGGAGAGGGISGDEIRNAHERAEARKLAPLPIEALVAAPA